MSLLILSMVHLVHAGEGAPALVGLHWGESPGSHALVYLCWGRNPSSHVSVPGNEPQFSVMKLATGPSFSLPFPSLMVIISTWDSHYL